MFRIWDFRQLKSLSTSLYKTSKAKPLQPAYVGDSDYERAGEIREIQTVSTEIYSGPFNFCLNNGNYVLFSALRIIQKDFSPPPRQICSQKEYGNPENRGPIIPHDNLYFA